jgi:cell division protein FtsI/penicillin-binding protein 2
VAAGFDSVVPHDLAPTDIGNPVLGGDEVEGTPLQLATVMAAVANDGVAVQPSLVTAVTNANGGARRTITGETRKVLEPAQAEQLRQALSATTVAGTAVGLTAPADSALWVKTGTHELYGDGEVVPPRQFVLQIAWVVGAVDTGKGRVSFAVAVETHDEKAGAARVRWLAQQAIDKITEVRG